MIRLIILLIGLISPPYLKAEPALPKSLVLSYANHPAVIQYHLPVIKQAYEKLGIAVEFIILPFERDLMLIAKGATDGDVIRALPRIQKYKNLITVGQPLDNVRFAIFCRIGKTCTSEILYNPENIILVGLNINTFDFSANWRAKVYKVGIFEKFYSLFKSKRFDYFVYVLTKSESYQHNFEDVNSFMLADSPAYHVLHKKYSFMQEQVSNAIKQVLVENDYPTYDSEK